MMVIRMLSTIFFSFLLSGCVPIPTNPPEENISMPKMFDSIELVMQTDKAIYRSKEPVTMKLTVINKGTEPIKLTFFSSQIYDFVVKKEGKEIWRWSNDKMFAMMLSDVTFEPNQPVVYEETWVQKDSNNKFVQLGKYEIVGILKTRPESESLSVTVEIKAE